MRMRLPKFALLPEMLRIQPTDNPVPSSRAAPHRRSLLLARLGADSAGAVEFLEQRLSGGQRVDASMFRAALWGCAKSYRGSWREALRLVRMMEAWLLRCPEPLDGRAAVRREQRVEFLLDDDLAVHEIY
mgnify:CR=1 FL=1